MGLDRLKHGSLIQFKRDVDQLTGSSGSSCRKAAFLLLRNRQRKNPRRDKNLAARQGHAKQPFWQKDALELKHGAFHVELKLLSVVERLHLGH